MPSVLLPVPHYRQIDPHNCLPACALTLPLIYNRLDASTPIIALTRTLFLDYWQADLAHAVVVVGYDERHLLLNDPAFDETPQRATPTGFLAAWGEFDYLCATISKR